MFGICEAEYLPKACMGLHNDGLSSKDETYSKEHEIRVAIQLKQHFTWQSFEMMALQEIFQPRFSILQGKKKKQTKKLASKKPERPSDSLQGNKRVKIQDSCLLTFCFST